MPVPNHPIKRIGYIGIDPGKHGGIAFIRAGQLVVMKMPATETDTWEAIGNHVEIDDFEWQAAIEQVGGFMGGDGKNKAAAHIMFVFGHNYGNLRMALVAAAIPFEQVIPRTWQKSFGIPPKRATESKSQFKNRIKAVAQRLFPKVTLTLDTCDAALIALYCKRKHEGTLPK